MATDFVLNAEPRTQTGTAFSRRLRRLGKVPGIVYGAGEEPVSISLEHRQILQYGADESFFSKILTLQVGEEEQKVVLRDLQRHPAKPQILHLDLMRVKMTETFRTTVPLHFVGEESAPGVKEGKGIPQHHVREVEIECLPGDLPGFIEVDASSLQIGDTVHLTDLKLPEGVVLTALAGAENLSEKELTALDLSVITVQSPAKEEVEVEAEEAAEEAGEAAEEKAPTTAAPEETGKDEGAGEE